MPHKLQKMTNMWDNFKTFFNSQKGGMTLGFTTFLGSIISSVFIIFVAPILGAEDFGKVSYFIAIAGITYTVSSFGFRHILLVYLSKGIKIFSTISLITLVSSLISGIVIFILLHEISIVILIIGFVIFELAIHELLAKQLFSKHMKYFLTQRSLAVVLSLSLYFIWGPSGFILGYGLSMFPAIVRVYLGFKESKIDLNLIKNRLNFVVHNYANRLSRTIYVYVDRLLVFPLFGFTTLGNYELAMQIIVLANVFSVFLHLYLVPKDARNEVTRKIKFFAITISIILSLMVIFIAPIILPLLFPEFHEAVDLIRVLGFSIMPHTLVLLYWSKFLGSEKSKPVLIGSLLHLAVLISFILVLTNIYSTIGLVIAFVLAEIVEAVFLIIIHKKTFKSYL